jgi:hypothetical protein
VQLVEGYAAKKIRQLATTSALQQQFFREYFPLFRAAVLKEGAAEK